MSDLGGRRRFLKQMATGAGALWWGVSEVEPVAASVLRSMVERRAAGDTLSFVAMKDVRLAGHLGRSVDLCIRNRIMAQDVEHLVEPFRRKNEDRWWQSEFWGKWYTSAAAAYRYTQDPQWLKVLQEAARGIMATQTQEGYIGNYAPDKHLQGWDIWGRKYTLLGLLAYHDLTGDEAALRSARRLADHLMTEVGPGKVDIVGTGFYRGMPSSSILEPMILLYRRTRDERYLDFAKHIVAQWETPGGPKLISKALAGVPVGQRFPPPERWWTWENGQKAYEMMSCYEGLLELYRETGTPEYLEAVLKSFESIRDTEINIAGSGAAMECWYGGREKQTEQAKHMMETCVTMTWMKFCQNLLRATGDPRFYDEMERSGYNALLGAMLPDGSSFAQYSPLAGYRKLGQNLPADMNLNCCIANAPRAMMLLPETAVMAHAEGPAVNLYGPGHASVPLASGNRVRLEQDTEYPAADTVTLRVTPERPESFALRLRVPAWSARTTLTVNGQPVQGPQPGQYARIERVWRPGDEVRLTLDLRGRAIQAPRAGDRHVAVMRGPIVLARDSRLAGREVDEVASPTADADGHVPLERAADTGSAPVWMAFRTEFQDGLHDRKGTLVLTDFASAGNAWEENSRYRVWFPQILDPSAPRA